MVANSCRCVRKVKAATPRWCLGFFSHYLHANFIGSCASLHYADFGQKLRIVGWRNDGSPYTNIATTKRVSAYARSSQYCDAKRRLFQSPCPVPNHITPFHMTPFWPSVLPDSFCPLQSYSLDHTNALALAIIWCSMPSFHNS